MPLTAGLSMWRGVAEPQSQRSELRLKDIERMENHTGDLRAKEKRPNFTKDMKEELGFSEKILAHLKEDKDVRRALAHLLVFPCWAKWHAQRTMCSCALQPLQVHLHAIHHALRSLRSFKGDLVVRFAMHKGSMLQKCQGPYQAEKLSWPLLLPGWAGSAADVCV